SRGRWEGSTLVVDVTNLNDQTWFQIVGGFHSDALHLIERWTPPSPDHIVYIVTVEDTNVYPPPWKIPIDFRPQPIDELWETAVWEGNKLALPEQFWGGDTKK